MTQENNDLKTKSKGTAIKKKNDRSLWIVLSIALVIGMGIGIGITARTQIDSGQSIFGSPTVNKMPGDAPSSTIVPSTESGKPASQLPDAIKTTTSSNGQIIKTYDGTRDPDVKSVNTNSLFHDLILSDIQNKPMTSIDLNAAIVDPLSARIKIQEALQNNAGNFNAEDFILTAKGSLSDFQQMLNAIEHKDLYRQMREKTKSGAKIKFLGWREFDVQKTEIPEMDARMNYICTYERSKQIDINVLLAAENNDGKLSNFGVYLTLDNPKNQNISTVNNIIDSTATIWIDGKRFVRSHLDKDEMDTITLSKTKGKYNGEFIENFLKGAKLEIVYGQFISDGEQWYFILSYRRHSLFDMRRQCRTLQNYGSPIELGF